MVVTPRLKLPLPQASDSMDVIPPAFATMWSNTDAAIGPTVCTSGTRPGAPYACQWIWQSDTNEHFIWDPNSSAWVKISSNPGGILGINTALNNTSIGSTGTRFMVASISGIAVEQNRNYRIHAEGVYGYTGSNNLSQPTETPIAAIHTSTTGSVTTGSTIAQSQYCDAWTSGVLAQANFAFDAKYNSGSNLTLSAGWSIEVTGSFNPGGSSFYANNTMIYVERV